MNHEASSPTAADRPEGAGSEGAIRVGSPFAVDPEPVERGAFQQRSDSIEPFYDVGPIRYTAMGAVSASAMVLAFGGVAAWWFPGGGVLIAALGCGLSLFGMASVYRITSIALLAAHLGIFLVSYSRSMV